MKPFIYLIVSAGLVLLTTACGSAAAPVEFNTDNSLPATPMPIDTTNSSTVTSVPSPAEQKMIDLSRKNLGQKLNISIEQIIVISIKQVTWRDMSLGCPKPGIDYMRVETPGYSIMLEADGKTYTYHTDESKRFTLCNPQ